MLQVTAKNSQPDLSKVRGFVSFISSSGNGHSLISSIIDAHKNAVVCREKQVLNSLYVKELAVKDVFEGIIKASKDYTLNGRYHKGSQTSHIVPDQYNGGSKRPLILGDKHGYGVATMLAKHSNFTTTLERRLGVPIYYIHVYRNPFDVIAHSLKFKDWSLDSTMGRIWRRFKVIDTAISRSINILSIKFEDFVNDAKKFILKILSFLNLPKYVGFAKSCSNIIKPNLLNERSEVKWAKSHINFINKLCLSHDYLKAYANDY